MSAKSEQRRPLPQPAVEEEETMNPVVTLVCMGIFLVWALVIVVGVGLSHGPWWAWWVMIVMGIIIVVALLVSHVHERRQQHQLHREEVQNLRHHRVMTELAIRMDHSAEHVTALSSLRTISKYMGPAASVTIKDNTLGQQELPSPHIYAPTFREIIGQVRDGHVFLGQGEQGPIWGDITDLLSTIIAGRPGTGKSTLLRDITGQLLAIDGKPVLFDPHGSVLDDLGTTFECAESPKEIIHSAASLEAMLDYRIRARRAGVKKFQPVLLIADEMPVISEQAESALPTIRRIISEGRKVSMFAIIAGVGIPAEILGGSLVRDAMASRYVFNTTTRQAGMAGISTEEAKKFLPMLETAGAGKAILARAGYKPELVSIPNTTTEDIKFLVPDAVPGGFPMGADPVGDTQNLSNGDQDNEQSELDLSLLQIVRNMTVQEKGIKEIASVAFPNMRDGDAMKSVRHYLAHLVKEHS